MSARSLQGPILIHCPAKINLYLSVGPADSTGYHPVETILQTVGLFDTLHAQTSTTGEHHIEFSDKSIGPDSTVHKAIQALSESGLELPPLKISIQKHIPHQSGLGGGSSNAAAIIRIAQFLFQDRSPQQNWDQIAAKVGVDAPFFLYGGQARGTNYGEKLEELPDPEPFIVVLAKPTIGSETAATYAKLDQQKLELKPFSGTDSYGYNDFERVAPCESLDLIERLQALGASKAALTGSGSAVYGIFDQRDHEADQAATKLRAEGLEFAVAVPSLPRKDSLWTLSS